MEKTIEKDGKIYKITISEYIDEVWRMEYVPDRIPMYRVHLYEKKDIKKRKWYHFFVSDYKLLHAISFKKSKWNGRFVEMGQNVFKSYEEKIRVEKKKQEETEKSIEEFKNWDGTEQKLIEHNVSEQKLIGYEEMKE